MPSARLVPASVHVSRRSHARTVTVRVSGRAVVQKSVAPLAAGTSRTVTLKVLMRKGWRTHTRALSVVLNTHIVRHRVRLN